MQIDRHLAEKRRRQKKRRIYFFAAAGFLALYFIALGVFVFVVRSPAFQVGQITIDGVSDSNGIGGVTSSTVMDLLHASLVRQGDTLTGKNSGTKALLGFHSMLIWPDALPSSTVAAVPQLAGITISKNYFLHTITVTATERHPFAVWCVDPSGATSTVDTDTDADAGGDACYWFDNNGIAFAQTLDTEGGAIFVIHDYAADAIAINGPVLPLEFMPNLISIVNTVRASGLTLQDISLNDLSLEQINVTAANGPVIYFSLRFPADEDLPVLQSLMAKPGFDKLQYIDFTVQNRAYYK